jgi:hypothetical protein
MVRALPDASPRLGAWGENGDTVWFFVQSGAVRARLCSTTNFDLAMGFVGGWIAAMKPLPEENPDD